MVRSVLLVDDDADVRESLAELFAIVCGWQCVAVGSFDELCAARERALDCDVAILDINLGPGQPSGLDAHEWLRAQPFGGRILFLTGHAATHPLVRRAADLDGACILAKPLGIGALRAAIAPASACHTEHPNATN